MRAGAFTIRHEPPAKSGQDLGIRISVLVLLFLFSIISLVISMGRGVNAYDEGIVLVGAARVVAGDLIHRDFYANYGPGQFYVLSALFSLFSPTVLVERGWDLAIKAGTTIICYVITGQLAGRFLASLVYLASLIWLASVGFYGYPVYPAFPSHSSKLLFFAAPV